MEGLFVPLDFGGRYLAVKGVLCDSEGSVYPIEAGFNQFNQLVISGCAVGEHFMVRVGVTV